MSVSELASTVQHIVPDVYARAIESLGLPLTLDMSRGNRCDRLTLDMYYALEAHGVESRRELHMTATGLWHYVIAHAPAEATPSQNDIVTDLNPWQYGNPRRHGPLHGNRTDVQATLGEAGAPAWFVGLRGIASIHQPHTLKPNPFAR